jgi:hypothetical protein
MHVDPAESQHEVFRLLVACAFYHPQVADRRLIRAVIDDWLCGLGPIYSEAEIRSAILACSGTNLEPFVLTREDLDCSVFLTRAAFSDKGGQTRLRIVSRETIGTNGGLVLTKGLKSFYVERYVHAKSRSQPKLGWKFFPSLIPEKDEPRLKPVKTVLHSDSNGFRIVIRLPETPVEGALLARKLQQHSHISGQRQPLSQLGLRVECHGREIHILSGSPESMIRLMAQMAAQTTLDLHGDAKDAEISRILIMLASPSDEPIQLRTVLASTPNYSNWLTANVPTVIDLEDRHKIAVSNWLRPHTDWQQLIFNITK